MRSLILICVLLIYSEYSLGQKEKWIWLKCFGGEGADDMTSFDVDNKGNIFIGGYFHKEIKFGKYDLNALGEYDAFIAKLNPSGKVIWAKNFGGEYSEQQIITDFVRKVVVDSQGNIIIAGEFIYSTNFGKLIVKSNGSADVFLAKLNTDGDLLWVKSLGEKPHDNFYDMTLDKEDNIYISYSSVFNDGISSFNQYSILSCYSNDGDLVWLKRLQNNDKVFLNCTNNSLCYITTMGKQFDSLSNKGLLITYYDKNGSETGNYFHKTTSTYIITSVNSTNDGSLLFTGRLLLLKDENYELSEDNGLISFGLFSAEGNCKWIADTQFTSSSIKHNMVQIENQFMFTNTFTKTVDILDKTLYPMGLWHNSYILLSNLEGNELRLVSSIEGMINTVKQTRSHEMIISGSFLSPDQLQDFNSNKDNGGFIDIFIGKRSLEDN